MNIGAVLDQKLDDLKTAISGTQAQWPVVVGMNVSAYRDQILNYGKMAILGTTAQYPVIFGMNVSPDSNCAFYDIQSAMSGSPNQ
jgi:hypothetical protein